MSERTRRDMEKPPIEADVCPNCESSRVLVEIRKTDFLYGVGADTKTLSTMLPVHVCSECGTEYTDHVAEKLRHAAVCAHLGVLTPDEIIAIREQNGMSRRQFAVATRIGLASISRWESSEGIQNPALDTYLRILALPEGIKALKEVNSPQLTLRERIKVKEDPVPNRFKTLAKFDSERQIRLRRQATDFRLSMPG